MFRSFLNYWIRLCNQNRRGIAGWWMETGRKELWDNLPFFTHLFLLNFTGLATHLVNLKGFSQPFALFKGVILLFPGRMVKFLSVRCFMKTSHSKPLVWIAFFSFVGRPVVKGFPHIYEILLKLAGGHVEQTEFSLKTDSSPPCVMNGQNTGKRRSHKLRQRPVNSRKFCFREALQNRRSLL